MSEVKSGSVNLTKRVNAWTDSMIQPATQSPSPAVSVRLHPSWTDGTIQQPSQSDQFKELVTVDAEQRLGKTLLQIAKQLGKKDPRSMRIEVKISHEDLGSMVGTTRPLISVFMQRFRKLDLIEYNTEHNLIVKEHKLTAYLASIL